jgi:hypothetical protein
LMMQRQKLQKLRALPQCPGLSWNRHFQRDTPAEHQLCFRPLQCVKIRQNTKYPVFRNSCHWRSWTSMVPISPPELWIHQVDLTSLSVRFEFATCSFNLGTLTFSASTLEVSASPGAWSFLSYEWTAHCTANSQSYIQEQLLTMGNGFANLCHLLGMDLLIAGDIPILRG